MRGGSFLDRTTPINVYFAPLYNQQPVGPDRHNFYLDLSISNSINAQLSQPDIFTLRKVLPRDLTQEDSSNTAPLIAESYRGNQQENKPFHQISRTKHGKSSSMQ